MKPILQYDLIDDVAQQVWSQFLGIPITAIPMPQGQSECAAVISIEGHWNGAVIVACSRRLARQAAATMLSLPAAEIDEACWRDTLNEVANIIGGNIKALLPGPSRLGLPEPCDGWQPAGDPNTITYRSDDGPLYVALLTTNPAALPAGGNAERHEPQAVGRRV